MTSIDLWWECDKTVWIVRHVDFFNLTSSFSIKNTYAISRQNRNSSFIALNRSNRLLENGLTNNLIFSCIPHCKHTRWKFGLFSCSYKEYKLRSFMYFHDFKSTLGILIYEFQWICSEYFKSITCSAVYISKIWVETEI